MECKTKYCKGIRAQHRTICHKCKKRRNKIINPIAAQFCALRDSARSRGKTFKLTIAEFTNFIKGTDYLVRVGNSGDSLTIDRIDGSLGYEIGNIQLLTRSENSSKYQQGLDLPEDLRPYTGEDLPF